MRMAIIEKIFEIDRDMASPIFDPIGQTPKNGQKI